MDSVRLFSLQRRSVGLQDCTLWVRKRTHQVWQMSKQQWAALIEQRVELYGLVVGQSECAWRISFETMVFVAWLRRSSRDARTKSARRVGLI